VEASQQRFFSAVLKATTASYLSIARERDISLFPPFEIQGSPHFNLAMLFLQDGGPP
jgi:hypothetical protein